MQAHEDEFIPDEYKDNYDDDCLLYDDETGEYYDPYQDYVYDEVTDSYGLVDDDGIFYKDGIGYGEFGNYSNDFEEQYEDDYEYRAGDYPSDYY